MKTMIVAALVSMTSVAAAESVAPATAATTQPVGARDHMVVGGFSLGRSRVLTAAVQLEGSKRLGDSPLFVHAQGTLGGYQQVRAGIEGRACTSSQGLCAFLGVDGGYQHENADRTESNCSPIAGGCGAPSYYHVDAHDAIVVPRAGVELGRTLRIAMDVPVRYRLDARDDDDTAQQGAGFVMSFGVGSAF